MKKQFAIISAVLALSGPVNAQVSLDDVNACFDDAVTMGANPSDCIDGGHNACMDNAQETPSVSLLCLAEARNVWAQGIITEMAAATAGADEKLVSVVQIETKYDLLANLLQCDRVEELSIAASDLSGDAIAVQTARCEASASGLTYMRLYLQAQTETDEG